jgi:hypothetical protein
MKADDKEAMLKNLADQVPYISYTSPYSSWGGIPYLENAFTNTSATNRDKFLRRHSLVGRVLPIFKALS